MNWVDFIIGFCSGSLFGIMFCVVSEKMQERDIDRSVRKEMEQLKSARNHEGRKE
ncbi:hypothetical protein [Bacillus cereus]|uniref:hypothetical protein n=1 Tax=Bacillus cereus TaxID=1396 RepID=UPI0015D4A44C|nr:hypothetical protein [Bacillus cereus]